MNRIGLSLIVLVSCLFLTACDEKLSTVTGPTPNLEPTLRSIQRDIFAARDLAGRQACTDCHSDQGRNPSGGLNLLDGRAHAALVGVGSTGKPGAVRVIPGDPDNSYLVKKLEGAADIAGVRMPRGTGPYLTQGQILVIRRWIQIGAPNN